jgi:hypothetical protein
MNIAEILRKLADTIDQKQAPAQPEDQPDNSAGLSPTAAGMPVDSPENQDAGAEDEVMVPPLQLKVELLKRAVGVDNIYDEGEPRADQANNDIMTLKRNAGIPVAAVSEMGNDEIFDD